MASNTNFRVSSMNVNGLGNFQKRKNVFNFLREKNMTYISFKKHT